jgi:hypothetical protein
MLKRHEKEELRFFFFGFKKSVHPDFFYRLAIVASTEP